MMSKVEVLKNLFPKCPVCDSEEGYEFSVFYPNVRCKACRSEWRLYEYGMELKGISGSYGIGELLDKKYAFDFWKDLKKPAELKITHRIFAPMDCMGGKPERIEPTKGYLLFKSENTLVYKGREDFLNKPEVEIHVKGIRDVTVAKKGVSDLLSIVLTTAFGVIGMIPGAMSPEKKFLIITYEDSFSLPHHVVFDFHDDEKAVNELITLLKYLKEKS